MARPTNPAAITGTDAVCGEPVDDPKTAGELWLTGATETQPAATPTCLLRQIAKAGDTSGPRTSRTRPPAPSGSPTTRVWLRDPEAGRERPVPALHHAGRRRRLPRRSTRAEPVTYEAALKAAEQGGDT